MPRLAPWYFTFTATKKLESEALAATGLPRGVSNITTFSCRSRYRHWYGSFENETIFFVEAVSGATHTENLHYRDELLMTLLVDWREHAGSRLEKFYKSTLWQGAHVMVGLNCLEPGQTQSTHAHEGADKFYFVLEGRGRFMLGEREEEGGEQMLVIAPAGVPHGVTNTGSGRLSLLVGIAPVG